MSTRASLAVLLLLVIGLPLAADEKAVARSLREGVMAYDSGRRTDALRLFDSVLTQQPTHLVANVYRCRILVDTARNDEADKALAAAIKHHPSNHALQFELGRLRVEQRRWPEALDALKRSWKSRPSHRTAEQLLYQGLAHRGARDYQKAVTAFDRAGKLSPFKTEPRYHIFYGSTLLRLGRFLSAAGVYDTGLKLFKDNPWLEEGRGWAALFSNQASRAEKHHKRAFAAYWKARKFEPKNTYRLPIEGTWYVVKGNGDGPTHRGLVGRYAWDFERRKEGRQHREGGKDRAKDFYAFGQPVLAPADGTIIRAVNDVPDNKPGRRNLANSAGNQLLIRHAGGEHTLMCHLRKGSLQVKKGDTVKQGQRIAECGNSGNSALPHLHVCMIRWEREGWVSLPVEFSSYKIVWPKAAEVQKGSPGSGTFVASK